VAKEKQENTLVFTNRNAAPIEDSDEADGGITSGVDDYDDNDDGNDDDTNNPPCILLNETMNEDITDDSEEQESTE
jgi:hypothetical protein